MVQKQDWKTPLASAPTVAGVLTQKGIPLKSAATTHETFARLAGMPLAAGFANLNLKGVIKMWTFSDFMAVLEDAFIGSEELETGADFEEVDCQDDVLAEFNSVYEGR